MDGSPLRSNALLYAHEYYQVLGKFA